MIRQFIKYKRKSYSIHFAKYFGTKQSLRRLKNGSRALLLLYWTTGDKALQVSFATANRARP
jgi:hypothetical protein